MRWLAGHSDSHAPWLTTPRPKSAVPRQPMPWVRRSSNKPPAMAPPATARLKPPPTWISAPITRGIRPRACSECIDHLHRWQLIKLWPGSTTVDPNLHVTARSNAEGCPNLQLVCPMGSRSTTFDLLSLTHAGGFPKCVIPAERVEGNLPKSSSAISSSVTRPSGLLPLAGLHSLSSSEQFSRIDTKPFREAL